MTLFLDLDLEFFLVLARVPFVVALAEAEGEENGDEVRNSEGSETGRPLMEMLGATRVKVFVMYYFLC